MIHDTRHRVQIPDFTLDRREWVLTYADRIPGWFPRDDMETLYDLASRVLTSEGGIIEVGSWQGRSSAILAALCAQMEAGLICVDTWRGFPEQARKAPHDVYKPAREDENFIRHFWVSLMPWLMGSRGRELYVMSALRGDSPEVARDIQDGRADLVFLDGDHENPGFTADLDAYWPKVRPGGILAGHDYGHRDYPDIKSTVDARFAGRLQTVGAIWWVEVPGR